METNELKNFFIDFLKKIFALFGDRNMTSEEENHVLGELGENEVEKSAIRQLCEEIDASNDDLVEWIKEGEPDPGQRLANEIVKLAEENNPTMTEDEKDLIPRFVEEAIDEAILNESVEVVEEIAGRPLTEEEVSTIKTEEN